MITNQPTRALGQAEAGVVPVRSGLLRLPAGSWSTAAIAVFAALFALCFSSAPASAAPQGPWQLPASDLSAAGQTASGPQLTTAPDGTTTAVWGRSNGSNIIIQAATRPPGGIFGTPIDLSVGGQNAALNPQVTTAPDGTTTAIWARFNGSSGIIQAATRPPGGAFGAPVDLSVGGQTALDPQITTAADGTTTAVWRRSNGTNEIIQAATRPPGGAFAAPVDLSATGRNAFSPQVASAPDGTTTTVWQRSNGTNEIIQAATRPPGGAFAAPVDLSLTGQSAFRPEISAAPDGTTTVAWRRSNGSHVIIQAATRGAGVFGTPVDLSATGQNADETQLTTASDGTTTVFWSRSNGSNSIIQAATRPPGAAFGTPIDLSAAGQNASEPQVTIAPDGRATAIWKRSDGSNTIIQSASTVPPSFLLEASKSGSGSGTVASSPAGIDCGSDCSQSFVSSTEVTLTATPDPGSTFEGWAGACVASTGNTCELTMLEDLSTVATFSALPKAKISKVKVSGPGKVKKGKKATYKVKITNSGNTAATGVRLKVSGRGVSFNISVGRIAAGKTKTVKLKIKFKKPGKIKSTFKVTSKNAGGKTVKKKITVRK